MTRHTTRTDPHAEPHSNKHANRPLDQHLRVLSKDTPTSKRTLTGTSIETNQLADKTSMQT